MKKAVLIQCMDARQDSKLPDALRRAIGIDYRFYVLAGPGGAGILSSIFPEQMSALISNTKISIELGAEEVILTIHGSSEHDGNGCGGYIYSGQGSNYDTVEMSHDFSIEELKNAMFRLVSSGIKVPIRMFYVKFGADGENIVEEVAEAGFALT